MKICLLLEHKSYKDPHLVFQLLEYLAQGYGQQIKTHAKAPELIVPILYYHGKTTWKLKLLDDWFSHYPPEFQRYLPHYRPEFIDLSLQSTEQLISLRNGLLASALLIQRHYFDAKKLTANVVNLFKSLSPYLDKSLSNSILFT